MEVFPLGTDLKSQRMNVKAKGNSYEIQICKRLSKWVIGKDKPLLFWKVGSSGAQATITKDVKSKLVGDIVSIDEKGAFLIDTVVIELKDVRTVSILDFISPEKKSEGIDSWWSKVCRQALDAGRRPALIFHRYGTRLSYIICGYEVVSKLEQYVGTVSKNFYTTSNLGAGIVVFELEYFLNSFPPWIFAWAFCGVEKMNEVKDNYLGETSKREVRNIRC